MYNSVRCRERLKLPPNPKNLRYAQNLKAEIEAKIARGEFDYAEYFPNSPRARKLSKRPGNAILIRNRLLTYIDTAEKTLQRSTWLDYKGAVNKYLIPEFGDLRLSELTRTIIKTWALNAGLSQKRINNVLLPLRAVMADALEEELIDRNPLADWGPKLKDEPPKDDDIIDPFEVDEIKDILKEAGALRAMIQFGFFTGLRTSELLALDWKDVDWRKGVVRIRRALVRKQIKVPKTKSGEREVPLLTPALEALKEQRPISELKGGRVWLNPRTGEPWEDDQQLRKGFWVPILRRAKVRYRYPYQMRHTFASTMLSAGENPAWIAAVMGHKDWGMIRKTYARWIPSADPLAGSRALALWNDGSEICDAVVTKL